MKFNHFGIRHLTQLSRVLYNQVFMSDITEEFEQREVTVMSHITSVFEVIFSWPKVPIFSSACSAHRRVNHTRNVSTNF